MFHRTHTNEATLIHSHDSHKKGMSFLGKQAIQRNSRFIKIKLTKLDYRTKTYFFMDSPTHLDGLAKPENHVPPLEMISTHTHTLCRCVYTCEPHRDAGRPVGAHHLWLFEAEHLKCTTSEQQAHEREFSDSTTVCVCRVCVSRVFVLSISHYALLILESKPGQWSKGEESKICHSIKRNTSLI